jgi:hypothetical protein
MEAADFAETFIRSSLEDSILHVGSHGPYTSLYNVGGPHSSRAKKKKRKKVLFLT